MTSKALTVPAVALGTWGLGRQRRGRRRLLRQSAERVRSASGRREGAVERVHLVGHRGGVRHGPLGDGPRPGTDGL